MDLTIFFPCYNDAPAIEALVRDAHAAAQSLELDHEIIVVDDGSTDGASEILSRLSQELPVLRTVSHESNGGYGAALRSGFKAAKGDLVFYTDGDGQYDPGELKDLYRALGFDVEVVNGWKKSRQDPVYRILLGRSYQAIIRLIFGIRLRDPHCDFRMIRRSALEKIELTSNSASICVELVKKLQNTGARFKEVPVSHFSRKHGKSRFFGLSSVVSLALHLACLWPGLVLFPKR